MPLYQSATGATIGHTVTGRLVARLQEARLVRETGRTSITGQGRQAFLLEVRRDVA